MKVILVALLLVHVALAVPGFGPPGFGGFAGGPGGWGGWGGWAGLQGVGGAAAPSVPATLPNPMAIGAINKQLGMNQAVIKSKIKVAENEIKTHLDALKNTAAMVPTTDPCGSAATAKATEIENELLTAFTPCEMKAEVQQMRMQSISVKQQYAAFKMAKKMCKTSLDPLQCMTDATAPPTEEPVNPIETVAKGMTDINSKSDQCIADVKDGLLNKIEDANDDMLLCA